LEEVAEIFRQADRASELMLTSGEVSGYKTRRLRVERARYENRLAIAELDAADARRRLAILILPQAGASQIYPSDELRDIPTELALETALQCARAQRAELESARANVGAAQSAIAVARRERLPEPTLTAGFKRQSDGFNGVFLGTAVPIPLFDRNLGTIAARENRRSAAEARLSLVEIRVEQDVRRAYETYASLSERVDLISEGLLGEADELLHAARVGYAEGEMSLVELLDAAEAFSDARVSSLNLMSDFHIAYFDLLRAAGGTIDRSSFTTTN
jgi:cobalt-zinc-cadmium efflux system outer membrane protein